MAALADVSEPGPRALDLRGLGAGRLQLGRGASPEIEYVMVGGPSPGSWKGLAGMAEGYRDFLSAWEKYRAEVEECRELDNERVLVLDHFSGRGKTSGLELGQMRSQGATLWHICGGSVHRLVIYFNRERALADLGLAA